MHLEGPWLSTTGKKKGKKKFASSAHARKARELAELWEQKQKEWNQLSYTGTKVKGIGTMHKSNAVPIFSDEEAVDISKMRR